MKKLIYLFLTVLIVGCSGDDNNDGNNNGNNNQSSCNGDNPVYLADNGVTIKACEWALIGDAGNINGFTYTVVSEQQLRDYINNGSSDLDRFVTTQVVNMYNMGAGEANWDVSNVTDMSYMFENGYENDDISNWDVSNVTDMSYMFYGAYFVQNISSWDVSNVTTMQSMFSGCGFNQPIGDWDVSNVTNMANMFSTEGSSGARNFDQDLSGWNVFNVIECSGFKYGIGSWTQPKPFFTNCDPYY